MTWVWVVAAAGFVIFVVSRVAAVRVRPRLDLAIRSGGFTAEQVQGVTRAVFRRGRLPSDPKLRDLGVVVARQGAHNFALTWWDAPLTLLAVDLVSFVLIFANNVWLLLVPLFLTGFAVQATWANLSGLRHARAIAEANPVAAG